VGAGDCAFVHRRVKGPVPMSGLTCQLKVLGTEEDWGRGKKQRRSNLPREKKKGGEKEREGKATNHCKEKRGWKEKKQGQAEGRSARKRNTKKERLPKGKKHREKRKGGKKSAPDVHQIFSNSAKDRIGGKFLSEADEGRRKCAVEDERQRSSETEIKNIS